MGRGLPSLFVAPFLAPFVVPFVALLVTVGFTSPSLAQEQVFSNDGMRWEGEAAAANEPGQDRSVLALDAARNLEPDSQLILAEPDADELARRMAADDSAGGEPRQTGFTREVAGFAQLAPSLTGTQRSSDGAGDYAVSQRLLGSAGAVSMRLHFSGVHLPDGARLYVYGLAEGNTRDRGYDSAWLAGRTDFWSHTIPGDRVVVEYHPPHDSGTADRPASYTVDQIMHNVVDVSGRAGAITQAADDDRHNDICEHPNWRGTGDGVMILDYVSGGRSFSCSSALLNDTGSSGTPYILTIAKCISTQAVASTAEIGYFYQRNQCSDDAESNRVDHMGATLLTTSGTITGGGGGDFTLLRASTTPPAGAMFLGWTTSNVALNTSVTGIHHPLIDRKRISFGKKTQDYFSVHVAEWSSGDTESGSGGSPAFIGGPDVSSAQVIGALSYIIRTRNRDFHSYSKFSESWKSFRHFLGGGALPNLIVDGVNVTTPRPVAGASFTINATTRNPRTQASTATTLRYYRSTDSTISSTDTLLATDSVSTLTSGAAGQQSAAVSIANTGTWWVGACVDAVAGESTTNNCSVGVQVDVVTPPDLLVENVSVSNSTPRPGASFRFNATVRNQGTMTASSTSLRYYRSADNTITTTDTQFATAVVVVLGGGGTQSNSTGVSIANTGTWWVGACVEAVADEVVRANNCSDGVEVNVTAPSVAPPPPPVVPPTRPDLTVDTVSVSDASVETGSTFTISATAQNSGNGASPATTLRYYRSTDDTITTNDNELTTDPVGALTPGATSPESAAVSIANTGNYWVGACVDTVNSETDTNNNCSNGVRVSVTARSVAPPPPPVVPPTRPDLTVDTVSVSDASVETGSTFTISATAQNSGNGASPATTLRYYRSTDDTITTDDNELTTDPVGALAPGATSPESAAVSIANTGEYWVGVCVGTVSGEADTNNNCSNGVRVSVTAPSVAPPPRPDLIVDTVSISDTSVETGASFTINATVRNQGTGTSPVATLRYVRSDDSTITASDSVITTETVGALVADGSSPQSAAVSIADAGNYWLGACVDTVNSEADTNNNCSTGVQISVTVPAVPDLTADSVGVSESTVEVGDSFAVTATVQNTGNGAAAATTLRYYRSDDSTITASNFELATEPVAGLAGDAASTHTTTVAISDAGTYWVGVCVDAVSDETARDNNCSAGVQVSVTEPADSSGILPTIFQLLLLP